MVSWIKRGSCSQQSCITSDDTECIDFATSKTACSMQWPGQEFPVQILRCCMLLQDRHCCYRQQWFCTDQWRHNHGSCWQRSSSTVADHPDQAAHCVSTFPSTLVLLESLAPQFCTCCCETSISVFGCCLQCIHHIRHTMLAPAKAFLHMPCTHSAYNMMHSSCCSVIYL